jgi:hypothetical protein
MWCRKGEKAQLALDYNGVVVAGHGWDKNGIMVCRDWNRFVNTAPTRKDVAAARELFGGNYRSLDYIFSR